MILVGTVTFTTNDSIRQNRTSIITPVPGPLQFQYQAWLTVSSQVELSLLLRLVQNSSPPLPYCEFNIAVSSLPEKPGFLPEFQVELEAVGGITMNLLNSFQFG